MNKRILLIFLLVFLIPLTACDRNESNQTTVKSVLVDPVSGKGEFTLTVTYDAGASATWAPESIDCYYSATDGKTTKLDSITPPDYSKKGEIQTSTLTFTATDPGEYTATCENTSSSSQAKTNFKVTDDIRISGKGQRITYSDEYSCTVPVNFIFIVMGDGSVLLSSVGPNIVDHINCTNGGFDETWNMEGTADTAAETASFASCNDGGFEGNGAVQYSGGVVSGSVTCKWIKGDDAGKTAVTLMVP